ncbi:hypothetical protein FJV41_47360 [Myxococcus llanfairpwllgwyngyllgogerychwyrndrobwllllantysiliogogogochensis]|uniref:DUF6884 domain-containing protein n=1 Tax=Myxococcus llanfairpwllgwyngyllgogerychwyrndrobwllllantysiliogogogochensis TaxID=2590453 RepID=A0A540WIR2_9BACT|nr:DUF6884 domain-containing protein [Myxococcus llanfairpwllgwyngyllgogerychwyrndrobwllllantysiliogogogochensis]TQF08916.1 hypothetical protein FJV41_47360 [Myxococcus llanfairpwllgwyngyllgogerychwyrndrobwllllantysiliogogogochensis]
MHTPDLFPEVPRLAPCSLCGASGIRNTCTRCDLRRRLFAPRAPLTPEEENASEEARLERAESARQVRERLERLQRLQRPVRVALLGCSATKGNSAVPAESLYKGRLFRTSLAYARSVLCADEILILSAFHGVVELNRVIAPYERSLATASKDERNDWAWRVGSMLKETFPGLDVEAHFLAGHAYFPRVFSAAWTFRTPLAGLALGQRYAALISAIEAGRLL